MFNAAADNGYEEVDDDDGYEDYYDDDDDDDNGYKDIDNGYDDDDGYEEEDDDYGDASFTSNFKISQISTTLQNASTCLIKTSSEPFIANQTSRPINHSPCYHSVQKCARENCFAQTVVNW